MIEFDDICAPGIGARAPDRGELSRGSKCVFDVCAFFSSNHNRHRKSQRLAREPPWMTSFHKKS